MKRPPRDPAKPLLTARELLSSLLTGVSITAAILLLYLYQIRTGTPPAESRSVAVAGLILAENFLVGLELFRGTGRPALSNRLFWITGALTLVVLLIFLYSPFVARMMQLAPISPHDWMEALLAAFLSTFAVEGGLRLIRLTKRG